MERETKLQAENAALQTDCKRKDGIIKGLEVKNAVLKDKLEAVNYNLKTKNYNLVASLAAANDRALVYRVKWEQADKRIGALTAACAHKDGVIEELEKRACFAIGALVTIHNKLKPCGLKITTNVLQEVIDALKNGPTKAELGMGE